MEWNNTPSKTSTFQSTHPRGVRQGFSKLPVQLIPEKMIQQFWSPGYGIAITDETIIEISERMDAANLFARV